MPQIFIAEYEGQAIAATLAMLTGDKVWYLYGASSNEHRNVMPNYLIQWTMIKWAKKHNCSMYDFRGVSGDLDESNPYMDYTDLKKVLTGIYGIYRGVGLCLLAILLLAVD